MKGHKDLIVDYGVEQLETIIVTVPETMYRRLIAEAAAKEVKMADVSSWGYFVELHEAHDGMGIETDRWATVKFIRRKPAAIAAGEVKK
jgi:hypothetical protein